MADTDMSDHTQTESEHTLAELLDTSSFVRCECCSNVFTCPLLLPCLHTFCQQCITEAVVREHLESKQQPGEMLHQRHGNNSSTKTTTTTSKGGTSTRPSTSTFVMHCPTCRSPITIRGGDWESSTTLTDQTNEKCKSTTTLIDETGENFHEIRMKNDENENNEDDEIIRVNKTQKKDFDIPAPLYKLITNAVTRNLPRNEFLDSLARLYRHRSESGRQCAYCRTEEVYREASSLCLQCQDDVCEECAGAHRKTRVTRAHHVVPYTAIQRGLFDHDIRKATGVTCEHHPQVPVTQFCTECLKVICKECQSKTHHGHALISLKEACAKLGPDIQRVHRGLTCRVPDLARYLLFLTDQLNSLDTVQSQARDDINAHTERVHQMVEEWKTKVISRLETAVSRERKTIEGNIDNMKTSLTSLKKTSFFLLHLSSIGKAEEKMGLFAPILQRYQQMIHTKPKAMTSQLRVAFNPGPATDQNIQMLVGKLILKHEAFDKKDSPKSLLPVSSLMPAILQPPVLTKSWFIPAPQSQQQPPTTPAPTTAANVAAPINSHNQHNCFISGIDIKGNMLAAVDRENARVIIADKNTLKVLKTITGEGKNKLCTPFDVKFLPSGVLAVTDTQASVVKVFDWTGKFIFNFKSRKEKLNQQRQCRRHQADGLVEKEEPICLMHPRGITLNKQNEVVVVDGHLKHCTVHDSQTGQVVRTIQPHRKETNKVENDIQQPGDDLVTPSDSIREGPILVNPFYASCTPQGNLVITDAASPNVKILRADGLVLEECMDYGTGADQSLHPFGVCTDTCGYILLADTINSRLQLGLPDGQFSNTLVSSKVDAALSHPLSVCLDEDDQIVVAQAGGKIHWYKYLGDRTPHIQQ